MSMVERFLFWIAIIVLLVAGFGMNKNISDLEKKATDQTSVQSGGKE